MKKYYLALALLFSITTHSMAAELVDVPVGAVKFLEVTAKGVQIYTCIAKDQNFAWVLQGPEADLFDTSGHKIGTHSAGPIWKLLDGSAVVGEKVAEAPAPEPQAIPWLLLRVKVLTGTGNLTNAAWIRRIHTHGGLTPTAGCDIAHAEQTKRVLYAANYQFFR
jgi:hypothetical protein